MIRKAPCKINLGLDVLRRRADGYHDVETVMFPVEGLCDEVEVVAASENRFRLEGLEVDCPDADNLCMRAVRLMQSRYGAGEVAVTLRKRVPFGAGLGGGSSDATAVILAMNDVFGLHLGEAELLSAAAALGSDTAFFVRGVPQLCTGRGEVMIPFPLALDGRTLVIVKPAEGVSTREAYAHVHPAVPAQPLAVRLSRSWEQWQECVKNDFEPSVFAAHPAVGRIKDLLRVAGAVYASMSGSGSAVYGLFDAEPAVVRSRLRFDAGQQVYVLSL